MNTRFTSYLSGIVLFASLSGAFPVSGLPAAGGISKHLGATQSLAGVVYAPSAPLAAVTKPFFDPKHPPTEARTFRVLYKGANGATVPGLLTIPGSGIGKVKRYPAVVLVHGLGGRKEDVLLLAIAFARRGYATLAIDLPHHGERLLKEGRTIADLTLEETRVAGAVSVTDLRRGVDFLSTRQDIDSSRIGCVGVSLGGIFGGVFAEVEPRIRAVALWSAGGDWGKLLTESQHPLARERRASGTPTNAASIEKILREVDPLTYAAKLAGRPLLLLAGTEDDVVPDECTDALFAAATEPKKLVRYPGGHIPDPRAMTVRTLDFFDGTLKGK